MPDRNDPVVSFSFQLKIQGIETIDFSEASGFDNNHQVIDWQANDKNGKNIFIKQFGNVKWGDITLKRGFTSDKTLWNLRQSVIDGKHAEARKDGTIVGLANDQVTPVIQFDFKNGWFSSWKCSGLSAKGNEPLTEEVTLVHEGLKRIV
jgi:phage tail-like protein